MRCASVTNNAESPACAISTAIERERSLDDSRSTAAATSAERLWNSR